MGGEIMMEEQDSKELATIEPAGIASLGDVMSTQQLKASINKAKSQRALIREYVKSELVEGVDYGTITSTSKSGKEFKSKPSLWKPGQEKIFSLMNLTSRLERDTETIAMVGNQDGVIAYLCCVYRDSQEIAQGRGAAKVGDQGRDINSTIKIAEKRARMDACLSLGFSEFFTQDTEDSDYQNQGNAATNPATAPQKQFIMDMFKQKGVTNVIETIKANDVADPGDMTFSEASSLITKLKADTYTRAPRAAAITVKATPTATEETDSGAVVTEAKLESVSIEPEVDQQFKDDVESKMVELNLTVQDRMRLFREATGMPVAPKTDGHWLAVDSKLNEMAGAK